MVQRGVAQSGFGGSGNNCGSFGGLFENLRLRLAGIVACGRAAECASDWSKTIIRRRIARLGVHAPGAVRAGYAEIFRV